ncbi:MAG: Clp1/GlmU family protein [Actinomycetota bacterium]|nr:Clp1/GlmU family protein [Actinomycetota bacterium]
MNKRTLQSLLTGKYRKVMIVGDIDTGKTYLARKLAARLSDRGLRVGIMDCDPGPSTIGPPGTVSLQLPWGEAGRNLMFPTAMIFVGILSPAKDVASMIEASLRLNDLAQERGCDVLIIDTSGMVQGSHAALLKRGKIREIRPDLIVSLDREGETRHIFNSLESSAYGELAFIKPAKEARERSRGERASYRRDYFLEYFGGSEELELKLGEVGLVPASSWIPAETAYLRGGHVLGLNDARDLTLALAILWELEGETMQVMTPYYGNTAAIKSVAVSPYLLDEDGNTTLIKPI